MNILLMNLTRFGDLLQSQAAIHDLGEAGHTVGLVCLENFAAAAQFLPGVSHVAPFNGAELLACLGPLSQEPGPPPQGQWAHGVAALETWRAKLVEAFPFDAVCNLTPSLSARLLARFTAEHRPVVGFGVDGLGFGENTNAWASFLAGTSVARGVSPFNIVDLFRRVALSSLTPPVVPPGTKNAGVGQVALRAPHESQQMDMAARLKKVMPEDCAGLVGFQLGASHDKRRWPVAYFAEVGQRLWDEDRCCPVLLGTREEQPLVERYAACAKHPFISLCGETSLPELAAALCSLRLLLTNDTGTMHFAVGLGVPVLAIFLMTAQPFDTGPYQEGSCSIEPDLACHPCAFGSVCPHEYACRFAVTPDLVTHLARGYVASGQWVPPAEPKARLWGARGDAHGFMQLYPLGGGASSRLQWLTVLRAGLCQFFDKQEGEAFSPVFEGLGAVVPGAEKDKLLGELEGIIGMLELLQQQGKVLLQNPLPMMRDKFMITWARVEGLLRQNPRLGALAVVWMTATQQEGQDLPAILTIAGDVQKLLCAMKNIIH